jgi:hypothetical protein
MGLFLFNVKIKNTEGPFKAQFPSEQYNHATPKK